MRRKLSLPAIFILIISAALSSCAPPPPPEMAPEASGAPENTGAIVIKSVRLNGASGQASAVPGETIMGSIAYQIWDQQDCPACRSQIVIGIGNDALDCAYNGVPGPHPGVFGTGGFDIFAPASPGQYDLLYKRTLADNCELARNFYEQSSPSSKDTIGTIVVAGAMPAKALSETAEVAGGPAGMEDVSGAAKEPLAEIAPEKEPSTAVQDAAGDAVSGEAMTVKIYYRNTKRDKRGTCSKVFPVRRPHTKTRSVARAALEELFKGPTQQEEAQGYSSRFSGKTASALKGIMIRKNTAYVNLKDLRTLMAEAGSSCGAVQLLSEMSHTVKQFRTVKSVIFAIEGSPKEFYDWLKIPCKEKNCYDPAPFQGR